MLDCSVSPPVNRRNGPNEAQNHPVPSRQSDVGPAPVRQLAGGPSRDSAWIRTESGEYRKNLKPAS